jgi:ABC-type branched-subunit amino acid transport system ATPase component
VELAEELHRDSGTLAATLGALQERGFVSFSKGTLEMDARQRIMFAELLIHNGRDPQRISRFLEWQEFENFAVHSFEKNGFQAVKHLVFRSRIGRREIDLLTWNDTFLLAVDCKHWLRESHGRMQGAAQAQVERAKALAERPDLISRHGVSYVEKRSIMPLIFALGEPQERVVEGVPIVSVSKLMSFLYGISPVDERFRTFRVKDLGEQSRLA